MKLRRGGLCNSKPQLWKSAIKTCHKSGDNIAKNHTTNPPTNRGKETHTGHNGPVFNFAAHVEGSQFPQEIGSAPSLVRFVDVC